MSKYSFKVYLKNGSSFIGAPSELETGDLCDFDKYVVEIGGFYSLTNELAGQLQINSSEIDKITILRNRKAVEFSLVNSNDYLVPVLNSLSKKMIQGNGPYQVEAILVDSNNETYINMRKYVFSKLKENYKDFLENIYTYSNEFASLLNSYGEAYHQQLSSEEDLRNLKNLEDRISLELRVYKNYRGMCKCRKKYEDNIRFVFNQNLRPINNNNVYVNRENNFQVPTVEDLTSDYNSEYEEYLDIDEYSEMAGDGNRVKGYK